MMITQALHAAIKFITVVMNDAVVSYGTHEPFFSSVCDSDVTLYCLAILDVDQAHE